MEEVNDDEPMLDMAIPWAKDRGSDSHKHNKAYANGSAIAATQSGSVTLHDSAIVTQSTTPRSRDMSLAPRKESDLSEDPQGLVKQVNNLLSIESPRNGIRSIESPSSDEYQEEKQLVHQLQVAMLPTGLIYDIRCRYHAETTTFTNIDDHHPECPRRMFVIYQELCKAGLVDDEDMSTRPLADKPLVLIKAREATPQEICTVHDARHYEFVESLRRQEPNIEAKNKSLIMVTRQT